MLICGIFKDRPVGLFEKKDLIIQIYEDIFREQIIPAIQKKLVEIWMTFISNRIELLITVLMYINVWMRSFLIGG